MKNLKKIYDERDELCKKKISVIEDLLELDNSHKNFGVELLKKVEDYSKKDEKLIQEAIITVNFLKNTISKNNSTYTRFKAKEFEKMHLSLVKAMDMFIEHLKSQSIAKNNIILTANKASNFKIKKVKKLIKKDLKNMSSVKQVDKMLEGTYLKNNFTSTYSFNELLSLYSNYHLQSEEVDKRKYDRKVKNLSDAILTRDYVKKHMPSFYGEDKHVDLFTRAMHQVHEAMLLDKSVAMNMRNFLIAELNMFGQHDHLFDS